MNVNINNDIKVHFRVKPKISKSNQKVYHLYVETSIYQKGIKMGNVTVSTGTKVLRNEFYNGKVSGRTIKSNLINDQIVEFLNSTKILLNEISNRKIKNCSELKNELEEHLKVRITGKPPKGQKSDFISKLKDYTYESVMNRLFDDRKLSNTRIRGYKTTLKLLSDYFNNEIPTIDQITTEDLEGFNKWLSKKFKNKNTRTTRKSYVAAVFKHGLKRKIISNNPLPENFRGSFVDGKREILSENDCLKLMNYPDEKLTRTLLVNKYIMMVQLTTGIGYKDLLNVEYNNIVYNENLDKFFIQKERNKSEVEFKVPLTKNGLFMVTKLRELCGDENKPFNIPSIDYTNRTFKTFSKLVGVTTNITTYTLRHTFSVNFMENGGRLEVLSKILGHTLIKTTQIYGKISYKGLSVEMDEVEQKSRIHQLQNITPMCKNGFNP
jgi:site-specific recombinase XerD